MRHSSILKSILLAVAGALASGAAASAESPRPITILAGDLKSALQTLAAQTGVQLLYDQKQVEGLRTGGVKEAQTAQEAVVALLEGTGLLTKTDSSGAILIGAAKVREKPAAAVIKAEGDGVRLAQLEGVSTAGRQQEAAESRESKVEEVVVTAEKRGSANIQDVPASITALGELEIARRGLVSMDDYLSTIPGANMAERGVSSNKITMRGVNASIEEDSTVGIFFGEVPLNTVARGSTADLKLVDVSRVEILRGPQGTLFGSGSMGGAVRNIPNAPDTERLEGKVEVGFSNTGRAGSENYNMSGVLNLPLIRDTLAIRLVGYNYD